jgi:hypothetical protein
MDSRRVYPCFTPVSPLMTPVLLPFTPVYPRFGRPITIRRPVGRNFVGRMSDVTSSEEITSGVIT